MNDSTISSQSPREQFDTLIDLLATDDAEDSLNRQNRDDTLTVGLRNTEGKLDFNKIRSFFSHKGANHITGDIRLPDRPSSVSALSSAVPTRISPGHGLSRSVDSSIANRPASLSQPHAEVQPKSYITRVTEIGIIQPEKDDETIGHKAQFKGQPESTPAFDELEKMPCNVLMADLEKALTLAKSELSNLRDRYNELHSIILELLGPDAVSNYHCGAGSDGLLKDQKSCAPRTSDRSVTPASRLVNPIPESASQGTSPFAHDTKEDDLVTIKSSRENGAPSPADVQRALDFVHRVDELVWRRSRYRHTMSRGPPLSETNLEALLQRVALWEDIARNPVS
ncbi:hypothetical protein EW146_g4762 [Bondarzewia mesenterica]|uniref:Uncharacterized protein n=1 Tax=Bondarzewia mesenterica TaxID=1095465 RepID=A0A4V3XF12_9AGAM|nr:hypothetical protein EW146_g4762 [Bondarzewia mesenterica]